MNPAVTEIPPDVFHGTRVHLNREDITELEVDAFVYYAQPNLALGSGFGGAIGVRGGASIQKELDGLAGDRLIPTGEAVITGAGKLKANFIIHAVGPRFQEDEIEEKLRKTMERVLALADENGMEKLALPAMGAGFYGIPAPVSAGVMFQALQRHLAGGSHLQEVVICLLDKTQFNAFESALAAMIEGEGSRHA